MALTTMVVILVAQISAHGGAPGGVKVQTASATALGTHSTDVSVKEALMTIANDFMVAWQKQDIATISTFLAPDFLFAGPHGIRSRAFTLTALSHCSLGKF